VSNVIDEVKQGLKDLYDRLDAEGHTLASDAFTLWKKITGDVETVVATDTQDVIESNTGTPGEVTPTEAPVESAPAESETPAETPAEDTPAENEPVA